MAKKQEENLIDPAYALWVFDVMLWIDELDEEQKVAVTKILIGERLEA